MSLIVLDIELTEKNIIKELGLFIDGSLQGFSFCMPKIFKANNWTTRNTSHLHGIAWNIGKLDCEKLFAIFYGIKVKNAEVFAEGLENCRLLTNLLGQNVENSDDSGCPKIQDLVKTHSLWICSRYFFRHKTRLHCAEGKAKMYGDVWFFLYHSFWETELIKQMTELEDKTNLDEIVFADNNQERKTWSCFFPNFLPFWWSSSVAFGKVIFQRLVTSQLFGLELCAERQDTFYPHQDYEQFTCFKISSLYFIGWSFRNWKLAADLQLAENWKISTKVWQSLLFFLNIPNFFTMLCQRKLTISNLCKE